MSAENELAALLARLRGEGRMQRGLAARLVPPDEAAAYRVAAEVARLLGWPVAGWKVAANMPAMQQALRASAPIYGRVFAPFVHRAPTVLAAARLLHPVAECEYVVELGADLPPREAPYGAEAVRAAVRSISPGMEIAECRFIADDAFPPLPAILADGSGSGSVVVGAPIADWAAQDIAGQEVVMRVNGRERRRGRAREAVGHPLDTLLWLANTLSRAGIGVTAGQVLSSGTCTGMLRARPGDSLVGDFGAFGTVEVRLES